MSNTLRTHDTLGTSRGHAEILIQQYEKNVRIKKILVQFVILERQTIRILKIRQFWLFPEKGNLHISFNQISRSKKHAKRGHIVKLICLYSASQPKKNKRSCSPSTKQKSGFIVFPFSRTTPLSQHQSGIQIKGCSQKSTCTMINFKLVQKQNETSWGLLEVYI